MEYFIENMWLVWTAVGILALVIELLTASLVSIWFVPAAVIVCLLSLAVDSIPIQVTVFVVLSAVFMVVFRKVYRKYIKKETDEVNADVQLIGKSAKTTEDTDSHGGRVLVGDVYWQAVSENGEKIPKGEIVTVIGVNNTTLVIKQENI